MNVLELNGWNGLRHGGLLLDPPRLRGLAEHVPPPFPVFYERNSVVLQGLFWKIVQTFRSLSPSSYKRFAASALIRAHGSADLRLGLNGTGERSQAKL